MDELEENEDARSNLVAELVNSKE